MQLFIDSYGAFLGLRNGMFWLKPKHNEALTIATRSVQAIFLTKGVRVSTDALLLALEQDIPVLLIDEIGHPIGHVWSGQFGSISTIRKKQALFTQNISGMAWIRDLLTTKINNQQQVLEMHRSAQADNRDFRREYKSFEQTSRRILDNFGFWQPVETDDIKELAAIFRGWEGTVSRHYLLTIATLMPEKYAFRGRSRRPAYDNFNALLNYLYGMLYAMVELALLKAGIDPYMGVLHIDRHNRPTMVYDFIEPYRCWAETVAIDLCIRDLLPDNAFYTQTEREGIWLATAGKSAVVSAFLGYMNEKIIAQQQSRKRSTHIDLDAQRLATRMMG